MTPAEFDRVLRYCRRMWTRSEKRGGLSDFDEFHGRVLLMLVERPAPLGTVTLTILTNLRREQERDATLAAHLSFEAQRPATHDVLPTQFEVPHRHPNWGGARKNSGGARPGAGRKPKAKAA